jgi:hypothetical protein
MFPALLGTCRVHSFLNIKRLKKLLTLAAATKIGKKQFLILLKDLFKVGFSFCFDASVLLQRGRRFFV